MTILYTDPIFLKHDTGNHPERIERLKSIAARLDKAGLPKKCTAGVCQALGEEAVAKVHAPMMIMKNKQVSQHGGGRVDPDTVLSADSFQAALTAAGTAVAAVDAVLQGPEKNALCLVRPPGHHATPTHSMGFCLFNNVALAARNAIDKHQLTRVLIVDWDVHHGNGTQDIFFEDPNAAFLSIHRFGNGFYPGSGAADETGKGRGAGRIFNAPVRFGTTRKDYFGHFDKVLEQAAARCKPELVIVSAGFDAHAKDPIGSLGLEVEDFITLTKQVLEVARTHAGGRLVSCLEGGYNLEMLAESVQAHLETLLAG